LTCIFFKGKIFSISSFLEAVTGTVGYPDISREAFCGEIKLYEGYLKTTPELPLRTGAVDYVIIVC
jgi:hypothetical protein